jgi:arginine decarboxylase
MNNNEWNQQPFSENLYDDSAGIDRRVRAPLYERLIEYAQSGNRSYHVPGHKNGAAYHLPLSSIQPTTKPLSMDYMRELLRLDVTEIEGTDDLHHPEGVIQEGQELAARCFGAEETYWLVGGSTSGNLALLLSVCQQPGDLIIVQRNVHKSVIHGLMLAGAKAVFLTPEIDELSGLAVVPSTETVRQALQRYPQARAVLLTSPNYYGMGRDLSAIAHHCHEQGIPLLVDEAHGAHYGHHPRFPQSALASGADGVVQSTHKMLSAMTMGAMLHVQGELLDRELVRQRLAMIQSSSPSYPIMASLDLSRYWLDYAGSGLFEQGLAARDYVVNNLASIGSRLRSLDGEAGNRSMDFSEPMDEHSDHGAMDAIVANGRFAMVNEGQMEPFVSVHTNFVDTDSMDIGNESILDESGHDPMAKKTDHMMNKKMHKKVHKKVDQDPFKVVLYDRTGYLSGQQLQQQLERYGCIPEMSDERYVVLVFSLGSQMEDATRLLHALRSIDEGTAMDAYEYIQSKGTSSSQWLQILSTGSEPEVDYLARSSSTSIQWEGLDSNQAISLVSSLVSEPVPFQLKPVAQQQLESISLEQAAGRVCAEMVIPYPPGIPVLYAGETISTELHARLVEVRKHGMKIQGAADASLESIRVYRNDSNRATGMDVS